MIDLDEFDVWILRSEAQRQGVQASAGNNDTLASFSEQFAATLFDPKLTVPIVRHDSWLDESFQTSPHPTRRWPGRACGKQTIPRTG